jgi:hypothetical protein
MLPQAYVYPKGMRKPATCFVAAPSSSAVAPRLWSISATPTVSTTSRPSSRHYVRAAELKAAAGQVGQHIHENPAAVDKSLAPPAIERGERYFHPREAVRFVPTVAEIRYLSAQGKTAHAHRPRPGTSTLHPIICYRHAFRDNWRNNCNYLTGVLKLCGSMTIPRFGKGTMLSELSRKWP